LKYRCVFKLHYRYSNGHHCFECENQCLGDSGYTTSEETTNADSSEEKVVSKRKNNKNGISQTLQSIDLTLDSTPDLKSMDSVIKALDYSSAIVDVDIETNSSDNAEESKLVLKKRRVSFDLEKNTTNIIPSSEIDIDVTRSDHLLLSKSFPDNPDTIMGKDKSTPSKSVVISSFNKKTRCFCQEGRKCIIWNSSDNVFLSNAKYEQCDNCNQRVISIPCKESSSKGNNSFCYFIDYFNVMYIKIGNTLAEYVLC
jgi:hypothetical protein